MPVLPPSPQNRRLPTEVRHRCAVFIDLPEPDTSHARLGAARCAARVPRRHRIRRLVTEPTPDPPCRHCLFSSSSSRHRHFSTSSSRHRSCASSSRRRPSSSSSHRRAATVAQGGQWEEVPLRPLPLLPPSTSRRCRSLPPQGSAVRIPSLRAWRPPPRPLPPSTHRRCHRQHSSRERETE